MIYDLQKASIMKRISAFLLDFVLMSIIITGSILLLYQITGYENFADKLNERNAEIEAKYNIAQITQEYKITVDSFQLLTEEERNALPEDVRDRLSNCILERTTDNEYLNYLMILLNLMLLIISLSFFIAFLVLEFFVPLLPKNGQTVGKKVFSLGVVRIDSVRINTFSLFVRAIIGKYTIGTMVPILMIFMILFETALIIPVAILLLILLLQIIMIVTTKTNSLIHDSISSTVVIDMQSQMIFNSVEDLNAYKLRIHKEDANRSSY